MKFRAPDVLVSLLSMVLPACRHAAPPPSRADVHAAVPVDAVSDARASVPIAAPVLTVVYSAYGGQGPMPVDASVNDFVRTVTVIDINVPSGSEGSPLTIDGIDYLDASGTLLASMRTVIELRRIPIVTASTRTPHILSQESVPFSGVLPAGVTRVRVEAWLTRHPATQPARAHVVVHAPMRLEADGTVDGEWPTA